MFYSCNNSQIEIQYPDNIGIYKLNSVIGGDSAISEINKLHHAEVAANKNVIVKYGTDSLDILYISQYKDDTKAVTVLDKMISKMKMAKNIPFNFIVPMKKYKNSFMTIGLGLVHYIFQSGNYLIWFSTHQKFYNKLPQELIEIYPAK